MKKRYIIFVVLLYIFTYIDVFAAKKIDKMTISPADTPFDISTENFDYRNIKYMQTITDSKYGGIDIDTIYNKTKSRKPISFNILLFNKSQHCIGYVSYCSIKELDSKFAQSYINPDSRETVTIPVDGKYLWSSYDKEDVKYIAFVNDNVGCKIADKSKYYGLSMYAIETGKISSKYKKDSLENRVNKVINIGLPKFLLIFLVIAAIYTTILMVINNIYNKMYGKGSILAWVPIFNTAASVRASFGSILAVFYLVFLFVSLYSFIILNNFVLILICCIITILSFMVNVFKIVSGQYTLLYLDFAPPNAADAKPKVKKNKEQVEEIATEPPTLINEANGEVSSINVSNLTMTSVQPTQTTPPVEVDTQPIIIDDNDDDDDDKEDDFEFQ